MSKSKCQIKSKLLNVKLKREFYLDFELYLIFELRILLFNFGHSAQIWL